MQEPTKLVGICCCGCDFEKHRWKVIKATFDENTWTMKENVDGETWSVAYCEYHEDVCAHVPMKEKKLMALSKEVQEAAVRNREKLIRRMQEDIELKEQWIIEKKERVEEWEEQMNSIRDDILCLNKKIQEVGHEIAGMDVIICEIGG